MAEEGHDSWDGSAPEEPDSWDEAEPEEEPFVTRTGQQILIPVAGHTPARRPRGGYSLPAFRQEHQNLCNLIQQTNLPNPPNPTNPTHPANRWWNTVQPLLRLALESLGTVRISNAVMLGSGSPSMPASLRPGGSLSEPANTPSPVSPGTLQYRQNAEPLDMANTQLAFFTLCCQTIAAAQPGAVLRMSAQDIAYNDFDKEALASIGITVRDYHDNEGLKEINATTFVMSIGTNGPFVIAAYVQEPALCLTMDINRLFIPGQDDDLRRRFESRLLQEYATRTPVDPPPQASPLYHKLGLVGFPYILAARRRVMSGGPQTGSQMMQQPQLMAPHSQQPTLPGKRKSSSMQPTPSFPHPPKRQR